MLLQDEKSRIAMFKLTEEVKFKFSDYISCLDDLSLLFDTLPQQRFRKVLNKFETNVSTKSIKEAIMSTRGEQSRV